MEKSSDRLPTSVIRRLVSYHSLLSEAEQNGVLAIASAKLALRLALDASQVRKDLQLLHYRGKRNVGYSVTALRKAIEQALGFHQLKKVVILGAGNLGMALAKFSDFASYGIKIVALFDQDPLKIGLKLYDLEVYQLKQLPEVVKAEGVEMAIITVPKNSAQKVADFAIQAGIKYLWNFAPLMIEVPEGIRVQHENLVGNFLAFTIY